MGEQPRPLEAALAVVNDNLIRYAQASLGPGRRRHLLLGARHAERPDARAVPTLMRRSISRSSRPSKAAASVTCCTRTASASTSTGWMDYPATRCPGPI